MTTTLNSFTDVLKEARRYLGSYDSAGVITNNEAIEEVASRASNRWWSSHDYGRISDGGLEDLHRLVEEEAEEYIRPTVRHLDGTPIGPCVARDVEAGYVLAQKPSARSWAVNDGYAYWLKVWPDGSATVECTEKGRPENQYWSYPVAPDEDLRFFEGVPWEVLDRFQRVRKWAKPKARS